MENNRYTIDSFFLLLNFRLICSSCNWNWWVSKRVYECDSIELKIHVKLKFAAVYICVYGLNVTLPIDFPFNIFFINWTIFIDSSRYTGLRFKVHIWLKANWVWCCYMLCVYFAYVVHKKQSTRICVDQFDWWNLTAE